MSLCGARPFSGKNEIQRLMGEFQGSFALRDRALVVLGTKTGLRISELLSLRVGDILGANGRFLDTIHIRRRAMKGKREGRRLPLHPIAKMALGRWLVERRRRGSQLDSEAALFSSRKGGEGKSISRTTAAHLFAAAAERGGLVGGVSTHSMRKWVASEVYRRSGNCLIKTGAVLGHRQIGTTWRYCAGLATGAADLLPPDD